MHGGQHLEEASVERREDGILEDGHRLRLLLPERKVHGWVRTGLVLFATRVEHAEVLAVHREVQAIRDGLAEAGHLRDIAEVAVRHDDELLRVEVLQPDLQMVGVHGGPQDLLDDATLEVMLCGDVQRLREGRHGQRGAEPEPEFPAEVPIRLGPRERFPKQEDDGDVLGAVSVREGHVPRRVALMGVHVIAQEGAAASSIASYTYSRGRGRSH
mmetsp:Transcript_56880/g.149652  ORF Transcript_56880/g.149652 Transcript_56880/m.149652 type:complete len:214 (+) Transcript_56880:119-760(+)